MRAGRWPLTGRGDELGAVHTALSGGGRGCVVLAGAAGVGKSRLAAEYADAAEQQGVAVGRVLATQAASTLPLGAFATMLPALSGPAGAPIEVLLSQAEAAVREQANGREFLLLVDDAHLLDDVSATLVLHMASAAAARVLATVRTGERRPDAVTALWKEGLGERFDIAPLTDEQIDLLLGAALGGPVDRATVRVLAHRCEGNVLFLSELVHGALDQGALIEDHGLWRMVGPLLPSARLAELIDARLGALGDEDRRALEVVALGEPIGLAEVSALVDAAALETLEAGGLLTVRRERRRTELRLAHPLHGELLRSRLPALRARSIARALAAALRATGARRADDVLRIAVWELEAGGSVDADTVVAAAELARGRFDFALAERLALAALDAGGGFKAGLVAAEAAINLGREEEAEERLAGLVKVATDDEQRGRLVATRMDNMVFWLGRPQDALRIGEEAEATISDPDRRDEVAARRAFILMTEGRFSELFDLLEPLLARATGNRLVYAAGPAALAHGLCGRVAKALEIAERGQRAIVSSEPLLLPPSFNRWAAARVLMYCGRLHEAHEIATAEYEAAVAAGSTLAQGLFAFALSEIRLGQGNAADAARRGAEAVGILRSAGVPTMVRRAYPAYVQALALSATTAQIKQAVDEIEQTPSAWVFARQVEWSLARAWVQVATGDVAGARALLRDAADTARAQSATAREVIALHDLARLGSAGEVAGRLEALAEQVEGPFAPVCARHARSLADGDADGLLAASDEFETMGALLLAAEAAADAATFRGKAMEPREATAAQRRAQDLASRCDQPRTPALASLDARVELTPTEREIAALAAAGHSNKAIAQERVLSVRTVENTLRRVYLKLGIVGREQLPAALGSADHRQVSTPRK